MDQWVQAYVLHARPYQENKFLLKLFSKELGQVDAVLRVSQKSRRAGAAYSLFAENRILLKGRHELKNCAQFEAGKSEQYVGRAYACACYLNELLIRSLPKEQPLETLFEHYQKSLRDIIAGRLAASLREFERELLLAFGIWPDTYFDCQKAEPIKPEAKYSYQRDIGFSELEQAQLSSTPAEFVFSGASILALDDLAVNNSQQAHEIKQIFALLLPSLIGDKPLMSKQLLT